MTEERIREIAAAELARIHGPGHSADWVLGYQACAKAIVEAVGTEAGIPAPVVGKEGALE